jgi:hypothetical protein
MRGPWLETQERLITLPDFNHDTFSVYHQWLLSGRLHSKYDPADIAVQGLVRTNATEYIALYKEILFLQDLSYLGHYLLDTNFTDTVSDALLQCTVDLQSFNTTFPMLYGNKFYQKIPEGSPTRQLVADLVVWTARLPDYTEMTRLGQQHDPDLVIDTLKALAARFFVQTPGNSPLRDWETSCKYHCHGKEKPCYREKSKRYAILPCTQGEQLY